MTEENQKHKSEMEELRLLYQVTVSDIVTFKQQQWHITNYALLLYVATVSIPKFFSHDDSRLNRTEYFCLFLAAFIVLASGWFLLGMFSSSLRQRQCRLTEIRREFSELFRKCWRGGKPESQVPDTPHDKPSLLWFFRIVLAVGFIAVSWLLFRFACTT
ncbi:MAG: hypothetical protein HY308_08270 [Gammaproteobacteria bacterium]|nr:hypothetical protein [Gammaproteobacteria bacterium]